MKGNKILNGRYEVGRQVGSGNYGMVFEGFDLHTRQRVAVKQLFEEVLKTAELMRFTQEEIDTLQNIDNRYIIKLLNHFTSNGLYYLIYEFCEKGDLKQNVDRLGRLSELEALKFVYQMVEALCELKRCGIIHRDIKPENIFLTQDICKLGDFGLLHKGTRVQLNASVGSLGFLAPETQKFLIYSSKADVYSLGICLYEMLHGDIPFTTEMIERLYEIKLKLRIERQPGLDLSDFTLNLLRRMVDPNEETRIDCYELRDLLSHRFPQYRVDTPRQVYSPVQVFGQATPERRVSMPMQPLASAPATTNPLHFVNPVQLFTGPSLLLTNPKPSYTTPTPNPNPNQTTQTVFQPVISNRHFSYIGQPAAQFPQPVSVSQNQSFIDSKTGIASPLKIRPFLQTDSRKYEPIQIKSSTPKESTFNFQALNSGSKVSSTVLACSTSHKLFQPSTTEYRMPTSQTYQPQQTAPQPFPNLQASTLNLQAPQSRGGYNHAASLMGECKPSYVLKPTNPSSIVSGAFTSASLANAQANQPQDFSLSSSRPATLALEGNNSYLTRSPPPPVYQQQPITRPKQVFNPPTYNPSLQQNSLLADRFPSQSQSSYNKTQPQQPLNPKKPLNGIVEVNQNNAFYTRSPEHRLSFPLDSTIVFVRDNRSIDPSSINRFSFSEKIEDPFSTSQDLQLQPNNQAKAKDIELDLPDSYKQQPTEVMRRERRTTGERQNSQSILQMRINFSNHKTTANFEPKPLLKKLNPKAPGPRMNSKKQLQNQAELVSPSSGHRRVTSENPRLRNQAQPNLRYLELSKRNTKEPTANNPLNKSLLSKNQDSHCFPLQTVDSSSLHSPDEDDDLENQLTDLKPKRIESENLTNSRNTSLINKNAFSAYGTAFQKIDPKSALQQRPILQKQLSGNSFHERGNRRSPGARFTLSTSELPFSSKHQPQENPALGFQSRPSVPVHNSPDNILLYNKDAELRDSPLKEPQLRFINVYSNEARHERASLTEPPHTHFVTLSTSSKLPPEQSQANSFVASRSPDPAPAKGLGHHPLFF